MTKLLSTEKLLEILSQLPRTYKVQCNSVRNLTVYDDQDVYIGYIDFLEGKYTEV